VLIEQDSELAIALLKQWAQEGKQPIAPALFVYEVTNIIYRQIVTGRLTYDEAEQGLTQLFSLGVSVRVSQYKEISKQAIKLAHTFHLPATYDAHYLALAHLENCEYWTADTRLWNSVKGTLTWVRLFSGSLEH
jgi:predicted nucleic acid-binding protein